MSQPLINNNLNPFNNIQNVNSSSLNTNPQQKTLTNQLTNDNAIDNDEQIIAQRQAAIRHIRMRGAPANCCAFLSTLDLLRGTTFLADLNMDYDDSPILAHILRRNTFRNCQATFAEAITATRAIATSQLNLTLEEQEDPWLILWTLRHYLDRFSLNSSLP
jgi:hypothetical protein